MSKKSRYMVLLPTLRLLVDNGPLSTRAIATMLNVPSETVRNALRSRADVGEAGVYRSKPAVFRGAGHCDIWAVHRDQAEAYINWALSQMGQPHKPRKNKQRAVKLATVTPAPLRVRIARITERLAGIPRLTRWQPSSPYFDCRVWGAYDAKH